MLLAWALSIYQATNLCTAIDGDTLRCSEIGRVRLLGIDAPETPGHCRKGRTCVSGDPVASKKALEKLVARGVTIRPVTRDRYGRTVAQVYASDKNLACEQLRRAHATYKSAWDNGRRLARECKAPRLRLIESLDGVERRLSRRANLAVDKWR